MIIVAGVYSIRQYNTSSAVGERFGQLASSLGGRVVGWSGGGGGGGGIDNNNARGV